mmetsp:Transcript_38030/g.58054  ORF Transcript_38030/g.58054 Transcript_38030/m.58054 type:complete len:83 (+) Transcript_38030:71-319(+)
MQSDKKNMPLYSFGKQSTHRTLDVVNKIRGSHRQGKLPSQQAMTIKHVKAPTLFKGCDQISSIQFFTVGDMTRPGVGQYKTE